MNIQHSDQWWARTKATSLVRLLQIDIIFLSDNQVTSDGLQYLVTILGNFSRDTYQHNNAYQPYRPPTDKFTQTEDRS